MSLLVIIPDMHNRIDEPKHSACNDFMDWFASSEYNVEDCTLLFEGDLSEKSLPESDVNDELHDFIERRCKAKRKIILQGNHDMSMVKGYFYKYLRSKFITIVSEPCSMQIDNLNCLMLPHYDYITGSIKVPMYEYYNNLPEELANQKYSFCFGHIMDETCVKIEKQYCDLSYLNIGTRIFGHNHNSNVMIGGNYLGSVFENSSTEKGNDKYIAVIDTVTKKVEYVNIPKTLTHWTIEYPATLPDSKYKYNIFDVTDVIDEKDMIEFYTKQAITKGYEFYFNKGTKKQLKEFSESRVTEDAEVNIVDCFAEFTKEKNIDTNVSKIVLERLNNL